MGLSKMDIWFKTHKFLIEGGISGQKAFVNCLFLIERGSDENKGGISGQSLTVKVQAKMPSETKQPRAEH